MSDWRLTENPWVTLGRYNAEVARGIVHTDEWRADMARLQEQFDEEQRDRLIADGFEQVRDGIWMRGGMDRPRRWWRRRRAA